MTALDPRRRQLLKAGLFGSIGLLSTPSFSAVTSAALAPRMITRVIPGTQESLPIIGAGANVFGVSKTVDLTYRREVLALLPELGGSVIDTAQSYGRSEEVIGRLIAELGIRERLFIATKTPLTGNSGSADEIIETSFRALRMRRIDLLQVHDLHRIKEFLPALQRAKDARRIRYLGLSVSTLQLGELKNLLRNQRLDFIQVGYSLNNRLAEPVLELAQSRGVAVIVGEPFGGRIRSQSVFAVLSRQALPDWAADIDAKSWAQVLLKYIAAHPAVTTITPGTDNAAHLRDNLGAGLGRLPNADLRHEMENYWLALRNRA